MLKTEEREGRNFCQGLLLLAATWSPPSLGSRRAGVRLGEENAPGWKKKKSFAVHREVLPAAASSTEKWARPNAETQSTSPAGLLAGRRWEWWRPAVDKWFAQNWSWLVGPWCKCVQSAVGVSRSFALSIPYWRVTRSHPHLDSL